MFEHCNIALSVPAVTSKLDLSSLLTKEKATLYNLGNMQNRFTCVKRPVYAYEICPYILNSAPTLQYTAHALISHTKNASRALSI